MNKRYIKKSLLGKGTRGEVWLVENNNTKASAAMKLYVRGSGEAAREKEILRRFGGKGVPYLIDCFESKDKECIVMEYVEGKNLRSLLKERKVWSEREAAAIIMGTAKILSLFHKQIPAVIYGDLKPENIMVTPEGSLYLIDFGSVLYEGERGKKVFGTREYLPPSEGEEISPYRDTYGLGVIFYEMLTGCVITKGIENGKADISHISSGVQKIMQKAVRIHQTEGYAGAGQLYEDLKDCMKLRETKKRRRKNHMFGKYFKKKENYFISDLKRMALTGYTKWICFILAGMAAGGILWTGSDVWGARIEDRGKKALSAGWQNMEIISIEEGEREINEKMEENEKENLENGRKEAVIKDEYGRKLIIRR